MDRERLNPIDVLHQSGRVVAGPSMNVPYRIPSMIVAYTYPCETLISFISRVGWDSNHKQRMAQPKGMCEVSPQGSQEFPELDLTFIYHR